MISLRTEIRSQARQYFRAASAAQNDLRANGTGTASPRAGANAVSTGRAPMLAWTVTFLIIALIAALLGFAGIAGAAAGIAQILFYIFLILFIISLVFGSLRPRPPH
jgi:uncharacterized membrane protein YtjA (UPF0391 family)